MLLLPGFAVLALGIIMLLRGARRPRKQGPYFHKRHYRFAIGGVLLAVGIEILAVGVILRVLL